IIRSEKRKRGVSGRLIGDTMIVRAPPDMPEAKLQEVIENFKKRFEKRKLKKQLNRQDNLMNICQRLKDEYFFYDGIEVKSIDYSTNQTTRWGVCNSRNKTILISHRLSEMPKWVRDYVIIHEMAHILEPNHSKNFWRIVKRYKLSERARGYLIAKGYEDSDESDIDDKTPLQSAPNETIC
ncbi:MAG: M48 family metallopeptidase, partial [Planctomycetota bacterium]|nr:M48 family metallopeptidase [Planctomycetota bacterium]